MVLMLCCSDAQLFSIEHRSKHTRLSSHKIRRNWKGCQSWKRWLTMSLGFPTLDGGVRLVTLLLGSNFSSTSDQKVQVEKLQEHIFTWTAEGLFDPAAVRSLPSPLDLHSHNLEPLPVALVRRSWWWCWLSYSVWLQGLVFLNAIRYFFAPALQSSAEYCYICGPGAQTIFCPFFGSTGRFWWLTGIKKRKESKKKKRLKPFCTLFLLQLDCDMSLGFRISSHQAHG